MINSGAYIHALHIFLSMSIEYRTLIQLPQLIVDSMVWEQHPGSNGHDTTCDMFCIVPPFHLTLFQVAMHITQIMGGVHPHARTCRCTPCFASRERLDELR